MADFDPIIKDSHVKYSGVFDAQLLYKKMDEWVKRAKFGKIREVKYVERVKPFGKIIDFSWECNKSELGGYIGIELKIKFLIVGLTEVEVDQGGSKLKLNKADLDVTFSSELIRNADKNAGWNDKSVLRKLYERFIVKNQIEHFKIGLYKDTEKIIDETKNFLALYRFR